MTSSMLQSMEKAVGNGTQAPSKDSGGKIGLAGFELFSEDDAARFGIRLSGEYIRYCAAAGRWFHWDGRRFAPDTDGAILRLVSEWTDRILAMGNDEQDLETRKKILNYVVGLRRLRGLEHVAAIAASKLPVAVASPEAFDSNRLLFNVSNGTIDLRTGTLHQHRRSDLVTKLANVPYSPDATCPRWEQFQHEIFAGDIDLIDFMRRAIGYSLSGETIEHAFFVLYGIGKNGKSTFIETVRAMLGDYAQNSDPETWLKQSGGRSADPGIARLPGIRMVTTAEIGEGRALDEARVKAVVAGDRTTARALYQNPFDFVPSCKLWFSTNYRPQIRGTDDGIWRRVLLVPFSQQFTGDACDPRLAEKLRDELPGILAWAVRGCLEWQRDGLRPPVSVRRATATYRAESDVIAQFIAEACTVAPTHTAGAAQLFAAYRRWAEANGERAGSQRKLGLALRAHGFESAQDGHGRTQWRGIALQSTEDTDDNDAFL